MSEKRNSGECRLFWILVHLGPRRCVGPREIRLAPHLRGGEHKKRQSGERIVLALDVQVCDQDEPADDGLVPDAGFARTRAGNAIIRKPVRPFAWWRGVRPDTRAVRARLTVPLA